MKIHLFGSFWREKMDNCFVCNGGTFTTTDTCFMECVECGLFVNTKYPSREELREELQNFTLTSQRNEEVREERASYARRQLDIIEEVLPDKGRIFDVGCGHGVFLREAYTRGWHPRGNDISSAATDLELHQLNEYIFCGYFEQLAFEEEEYDAVVMCHSLEHLHNPKKDLINAYNMLRKGGVLSVEVPERNLSNLKKFLEVRHHVEFNKKNLRKLVEDTGFKVLRHESQGDEMESQSILCQK